MPSSHLNLCCPLLLPPPIPPSITVFSNESTLRMRWPKYWSFSFSISPSNEQPGLISFSMDWLDLLAVQGTLKSLLQFKSINFSVLSFLHSPTLTSSHNSHKPVTIVCHNSWFHVNIGLAKKFIWVFPKMLQKNLNELFGQPNIYMTWTNC